MPKKSELQTAIDQLQSEIDVLLLTKQRLLDVREAKPKRTRKAQKPQAAEKQP